MSDPITFTVYGDAKPKGSARAFMPSGATFPVVTSATKGLKEWERKIAAVAQSVASGVLLTGPILLGVTFYLSKPKSLKKATSHLKRPDLDKLVRGATDALTGVIWKDDSQIVGIHASKYYVFHDDEAPSARFSIQEGTWTSDATSSTSGPR